MNLFPSPACKIEDLQIDLSSVKDQEYQVLRITGMDSSEAGQISKWYNDTHTWLLSTLLNTTKISAPSEEKKTGFAHYLAHTEQGTKKQLQIKIVTACISLK